MGQQNNQKTPKKVIFVVFWRFLLLSAFCMVDLVALDFLTALVLKLETGSANRYRRFA